LNFVKLQPRFDLIHSIECPTVKRIKNFSDEHYFHRRRKSDRQARLSLSLLVVFENTKQQNRRKIKKLGPERAQAHARIARAFTT
jgi:pyoverdine/dityrosine biosynthesis protein Dit1